MREKALASMTIQHQCPCLFITICTVPSPRRTSPDNFLHIMG
jgi:hypothetical protein